MNERIIICTVTDKKKIKTTKLQSSVVVGYVIFTFLVKAITLIFYFKISIY